MVLLGHQRAAGSGVGRDGTTDKIEDKGFFFQRSSPCLDKRATLEGLWASLENEMHRRRTFAARDEAKFACIEWIEGFYDRRRPHGYRHPADVMADFKRRTEEGSDFLAA